MEDLAAAERRARHSGVTVLLASPAGTGKSRLLTEVMRNADDAGFLVLLGECRDGGAESFEPFTSALARYERTLLPQETEEMFAGRARFARVLVPHLLSEASESVQSPSPAHLQAALVEILTRLCAERPLLLALEDIHWASTDGLSLLAALTREIRDLPILIVATYRPGEAEAPDQIEQVISDVHRSHSGERIQLEPLRKEEVALMLEAMFPGIHFSERFTKTMWERAGGNPFFVEEICRTLVQENMLPAQGDTATDLPEDVLPEAVRTSVLNRVRRTAARTRHVLAVAAVAGETIDRQLLARACHLPNEAIDIVMEEALEAEAVVERFDGPVPYLAFAHALTRDALVSSMASASRRDAHKQLGAAKTELYPNEPERVAGEISDHLAAAGDRPGAYHYAALAARFAARRGASAEAIQRYEQCLELADSDETRLPIALEAARLQPWLNPEEAKVLAERAQSLARRLGQADREAEALVVSARVAWLLGSPEAPAIFERALDLVDGRGDRAELTVLLETAWHLSRSGWRDHAERAQELIRRAAPLAEAIGGAFELGRLEIARARSTKFTLDSIAAACSKARRLFADAGNVYEQAGCDAVEGNWALLHEGSFRHAQRCLQNYEAAMDKLSPRRPSVPFSASTLAAAWMGDFATARTKLESPTWEDSPLSEASRIEALIEIELRSGDPKIALRSAHRGWEIIQHQRELDWLLPMLAGLARATLTAEGFQEARPWFERALENAARGHGAYHWYFSPDYARALFDASLTEDVADLRTRIDEITVVCGEHAHDLAARSYVRALDDVLGEDLPQAREHLRDALQRWDAMPYPARSCEGHLAMADLERRAGDRTSSAAAAADALEIAQAIGSPPLMALARAALDRLGRPGRRREAVLAGPESLTAREKEIVRLTVAGLTAQQIAERLVLSRRTVEGHLGRAKDKLGAASKADLVRKAVKLDL